MLVIKRYNNLLSSTNYSFYLQESNNVDMSLNWWGTTDDAAISQSVYDFKNDFNLGTVTYQPILNAFNPNAPADLPIIVVSPPVLSPTPTATTSTTAPTPSPTPTIPELTTTITLATILTATTATILYKKTNQKQN